MKISKQILKKQALLITVTLAASLGACTSPPNTTNQANNTTPPATTTTPETAPPANTTPPSQTLEGVSFQAPQEGQNVGFIDAFNGVAPQPAVTVSPGAPIEISGWAVLPDGTKSADTVIVTVGEEKAIAATTPVNLDRPDVSQSLNNPNFAKSGWVVQVDPASLSGAQVALQAWAYNATTKQAYPLGGPITVTLK